MNSSGLTILTSQEKEKTKTFVHNNLSTRSGEEEVVESLHQQEEKHSVSQSVSQSFMQNCQWKDYKRS